MNSLKRRDFLALGARLAAGMGLGAAATAQLADAAEALAAGDRSVLWLQAQSCSGCSVALLNSARPGPAEILTRYINLLFHSTLSTSTGAPAMRIVEDTIARGDYFLVVEGSIPANMPQACLMGGQPLGELIAKAGARARAVLAIGTCAAFGGIPAAEGNPTGAMEVGGFLRQRGIKTPLVRLPGCPCHPDWFVGTIVHTFGFGLPALDSQSRPLVYYGRPIHEQCPRFADYERERFARKLGEDGCLFQLGCQGPVTHADCTVRQWNGGTNTCIRAGAPCLGCSGESFAARKDLPFYTMDRIAADEETRA